MPTWGSSVRIRSFAQGLFLEISSFVWRRTQAVRERFAKPSCTSSNLVDASNATKTSHALNLNREELEKRVRDEIDNLRDYADDDIIWDYFPFSFEARTCFFLTFIIRPIHSIFIVLIDTIIKVKKNMFW